MSGNVVLSNKKILGGGLTPDIINMFIREAITQLDNRAKAMPVEVDWSTLTINMGDAPELDYGLKGVTIYPNLDIEVQGWQEEKND